MPPAIDFSEEDLNNHKTVTIFFLKTHFNVSFIEAWKATTKTRLPSSNSHGSEKYKGCLSGIMKAQQMIRGRNQAYLPCNLTI